MRSLAAKLVHMAVSGRFDVQHPGGIGQSGGAHYRIPLSRDSNPQHCPVMKMLAEGVPRRKQSVGHKKWAARNDLKSRTSEIDRNPATVDDIHLAASLESSCGRRHSRL